MSVQDMIVSTATAAGVDPQLALSVAQRESGFNQNARGAAGEVGVFQLMLSTAAGLNVNPYDLSENISGGVKYLANLLAQFAGDAAKALAGYNWGQGRVGAAVSQYGDEWYAHIPTAVQSYVEGILGTVPSFTFRTTVVASSPIPTWLWLVLAVIASKLVLD